VKKSLFTAFVLCLSLVLIMQTALPRQADAGPIKSIVLYVPNRVFDILDIIRLRLRVGPGISVGVHATEVASLFLGTHTTVWAGLHGPRGKTTIPWIVGVESRSGVQVGPIDPSVTGCYYDPLEIGLELQPLLIGLNFGIGLFEVVDFITGLLFIDLQEDDF
jgi:hypothetical protein